MNPHLPDQPQYRRPRPRLVLAVALAALTLVACGSGSGDPDVPPGRLGILGYLPAEAIQVELVDVKLLRSKLGLPTGADATDPAELEKRIHADTHRLVEETSVGFPPLKAYLETQKLPPSGEAISGSELQLVARAGFDAEMVAAITTTQPFEEIAAALERRGFERRGDALVAVEEDLGDPVRSVATAADGTIILPDVAAKVAAEGGEIGAASAVLPGLEGPTSVAATGVSDGCVSAYAVGLSASGSKGQLQISVAEDPADPSRFQAPRGFGELEFGSAEADGNRLLVPFRVGSAPTRPGRGPALSLATRGFSALDAYEC